jgi:hypothetical protein
MVSLELNFWSLESEQQSEPPDFFDSNSIHQHHHPQPQQHHSPQQHRHPQSTSTSLVTALTNISFKRAELTLSIPFRSTLVNPTIKSSPLLIPSILAKLKWSLVTKSVANQNAGPVSAWRQLWPNAEATYAFSCFMALLWTKVSTKPPIDP